MVVPQDNHLVWEQRPVLKGDKPKAKRNKVHTQDKDSVPLARAKSLGKGTKVDEVRQGDRLACELPSIQRIPQAVGVSAGSKLRVSNACSLLHLYGAYTNLSHCALKG